MTENALVIWIIAIIVFLFVVFAGAPDLQDALISHLMDDCPTPAE